MTYTHRKTGDIASPVLDRKYEISKSGLLLMVLDSGYIEGSCDWLEIPLTIPIGTKFKSASLGSNRTVFTVTEVIDAIVYYIGENGEIGSRSIFTFNKFIKKGFWIIVK